MGPLLADSVLGATSDTKESPSSQEAGRDVSSQLPLLLEQNQDLWKDRENHLYTDSASSAGKYLETIHSHFKGWSVSYNKWTGPLETQAGQLPVCAWSAEEKIKWRNGSEHRGQYGWLRYQPGGCEHPPLHSNAKDRRVVFCSHFNLAPPPYKSYHSSHGSPHFFVG